MGKKTAAKLPAQKCCDTCRHYARPKSGVFCGECQYPVPAWILVGASGGGFVGSPEHEGQDCMTYELKPAE